MIAETFDIIKPIVIKDINGKYQNYEVEFKPKEYELKTIENVKIGMSVYVYKGMVCKNT